MSISLLRVFPEELLCKLEDPGAIGILKIMITTYLE